MERPAAPGTLFSIHSVYEDPFLPNKWTTKYPVQAGAPVEDAESAQHALVARYRISKDPSKTLDLHSVVVQSPLLKGILARVLEGYPSITTELERLEFKAPFECFVHRWDALRVEREELVTQLAEDGPFEGRGYKQALRSYLDLLYVTLERELGSLLRQKKDLITHGVMQFKHIWTLFEPGCLIYYKAAEQDRIYKLKSSKLASVGSRKVFQLECQYVDYDGTQFGYGLETLNINDFPGTKKITKFEAYPLCFHENVEELMERLAERGRQFELYKGNHFVAYDGIAFGKAHRGEQKFSVKSRIVIDAHAYARYNQRASIEYFETPEVTQETASSGNGEETDEDCVMVDENATQKRAPAEVGKRPAVIPESKFALTTEQHLMADAKVRGYSLRDKKWFSFFIDNVKDIEWNGDAFKSLVAPQEQKDLILSFAESQIKNREHFDDFIQGKGKGIIMLLSGPPGVGKTLTAESVAETMKAPLYSIGAADLGSKPAPLEKSLHDILEMCTKWGAGKRFPSCLLLQWSS